VAVDQNSTLRQSVASFRKQLIDNADFRREFAADPDGTLRKAGIDVPAGAAIGPIDVSELDGRIGRLKEALGEDIGALYSVEEYEELARDPQKVLHLQEVMNSARRQAHELNSLELEAVAGGRKVGGGGEVGVYWISAYSTLDW
jgi:hypothetical protein